MKAFLVLVLSCLLICTGCDKRQEPEVVEDLTVKAIGTYSSIYNVDKTIWGDYQLILELDKSTYTVKEPIPTKLYFKNIGTKAINLTFVVRQSVINSPPKIDIWTKDGRKYMVHKLIDNLKDTLTIEPKTSALLMEFNLIDVRGTIYSFNPSTGFYHGVGSENIGEEFGKGIYYMSASFVPLPHIYESITDTLSFEIK